MNSAVTKFCFGLVSIISGLLFLLVFLFAVLLVLFSPLPQLIVHARWCWVELGWIGKVILSIGLSGVLGIVFGLIWKKTSLHRAAMLLAVVPVIGVTVHRIIKTGGWYELLLLVAFLLTSSLIYFTAVLIRMGEEETVK